MNLYDVTRVGTENRTVALQYQDSVSFSGANISSTSSIGAVTSTVSGNTVSGTSSSGDTPSYVQVTLTPTGSQFTLTYTNSGGVQSTTNNGFAINNVQYMGIGDVTVCF